MIPANFDAEIGDQNGLFFRNVCIPYEDTVTASQNVKNRSQCSSAENAPEMRQQYTAATV